MSFAQKTPILPKRPPHIRPALTSFRCVRVPHSLRPARPLRRPLDLLTIHQRRGTAQDVRPCTCGDGRAHDAHLYALRHRCLPRVLCGRALCRLSAGVPDSGREHGPAPVHGALLARTMDTAPLYPALAARHAGVLSRAEHDWYMGVCGELVRQHCRAGDLSSIVHTVYHADYGLSQHLSRLKPPTQDLR